MGLTQKIKSFISFLIRISLSLGLLWYVFSQIDVENTFTIVKSAEWTYLAAAAGFFLLINGILLWRWQIFIKALDLSVSPISVAKHYFYGLFGNLFLPTAIGGDLIKVVGLCKDSSQKPKVVASVLLDRLSGFASIILIEVCMLLWGAEFVLQDKVLLGSIVAIACGSLVISVVLFHEKIYTFVFGIFALLPRVRGALMKLHYDIALLKQRHKAGQGFKAVGISCLSQVIFAYTWFLVAKALHQDFSFMPFMVFTPLLCIASSFPSIGGLGVREAGAVYLFSKVGMETEVAVSLSLINFSFMVLVGAAGGMIYVYSLFAGRIQSDPQNAAGFEPREA